MLWIVHDEPGGQQRTVIECAAEEKCALWITIDQEPPDVALFDTWEASYEALAATAARLAHRHASGKDLVVSTLSGFGGDFQRPIRLADHNDKSLNFVTWLKDTPDVKLPDQIIIAGLSTLYDHALASISGSLPKAGIERGVELVQAIAGSAITHVMWDLERSGIPILASAWDTTVNKKRIPHIPMGVRNIGQVIPAEKFDYVKWREIVGQSNS